MEKKPEQTPVNKDNALFRTINSNDDKVCRSFRSNYFEPIPKMPSEEVSEAVIDIHNRL